MLALDHLAVSAHSLAEGVAWLEDRLNAALAGGGRHPLMGTHNRLLGLGDLYLEVIAVDPGAPPPARPRWFGLDRFAGPPRLTNWIASCEDLEAELARSPPGAGRPVELARGDFCWRMAVPEDGSLPFDGAFPALICWDGALHPAPLLPESHIRLEQLEIAHPEAQALRQTLSGRFADPRIIVTEGREKAIRARLSTPGGPRVIE